MWLADFSRRYRLANVQVFPDDGVRAPAAAAAEHARLARARLERDGKEYQEHQWGPLPNVVYTFKPLLARYYAETYRSRGDIDMKEINRRIQEQYALVEALQEWLDRRLPN
jgi:predicted nucleotidyltransferase